MKKRKAPAKLRLSRETLRILETHEVTTVAGGFPTSVGICLPVHATQCNCFD